MDEAVFRRMGAYFCVAAITVYIICTVVSMLFYTMPFSLLGNWIGDLGSTTFNPQGAIIYNIGIVLAGLLLLPFVASFVAWHIGPKWSRYMLIVAEITGFGLCFGMILLGIFSEDAGSLHLHLTEFVFVTLTLMIFLVNVALFRNVRYGNLIIPLLGFFAFLLSCAQIGLYLINIKPSMFLWLSVYSSLLWILLFCYNALATRAPDLVQTRHKIL